MGSPHESAPSAQPAASGKITFIPPTAELKSQARRLRLALNKPGRSDGNEITHSGALELVARLWGQRDWNTLAAVASAASTEQRAAAPQTVPWSLGDTVTGAVFGKPFRGRLLGMTLLPNAERVRVSVQLDEPVDVVDFASFSSERHRVTAILSTVDGRSLRRRSDGKHQLELALPTEPAS